MMISISQSLCVALAASSTAIAQVAASSGQHVLGPIFDEEASGKSETGLHNVIEE